VLASYAAVDAWYVACIYSLRAFIPCFISSLRAFLPCVHLFPACTPLDGAPPVSIDNAIINQFVANALLLLLLRLRLRLLLLSTSL
jgi:hypothetical protein